MSEPITAENFDRVAFYRERVMRDGVAISELRYEILPPRQPDLVAGAWSREDWEEFSAKEVARLTKLARAERLDRIARWAAFFGILFGLMLGLTVLAHAQDGLYRPQPIPAKQSAPLMFGGLMIDPDSIVEMDSTRAAQYPPPAEYDQWWQEDIACAGPLSIVNNPLQVVVVVPRIPVWPKDIAWVTIPEPVFRVHGSGPFVGYTDVENMTVIIPDRYIHNRQLVRHEMLHAMLWKMNRADYGHPKADPIFRACGLLGQ